MKKIHASLPTFFEACLKSSIHTGGDRQMPRIKTSGDTQNVGRKSDQNAANSDNFGARGRFSARVVGMKSSVARKGLAKCSLRSAQYPRCANQYDAAELDDHYVAQHVLPAAQKYMRVSCSPQPKVVAKLLMPIVDMRASRTPHPTYLKESTMYLNSHIAPSGV